VSEPPLQTGYLVNEERFNHLWRVAEGFARSSLVPESFRGNQPNCFIAAQLSLRLNCDLFMLMQNMYVVHGKPAFEAKFCVSLLNSSGKIRGTVKYKFDGDGDEHGCTAWAIDALTGERIEGPKVDWIMVKGEGWDKPKKSQTSKWVTMPRLMFHYRAASFLVKTHYPEVLMGMQTREELEDSVIDVVPVQEPNTLDQLTDRLEHATEPAGTSGQAEEPAEGEASGQVHAFAWDDALRKARTIRECQDIADKAREQHPGEADRIDALVAERVTEIRATRGQRSNDSPADEPTPQSSAADYQEQLKAATTRDQLNAIEAAFSADAELSREDSEILYVVYRGRCEEVG
jgi:hypothetical protein